LASLDHAAITMISRQHASIVVPDVEKRPCGNHIEDIDMTDKEGPKEGGDYSGAAAKSDPAEIALVKKLDYRIMPILWSMYFLNYVCRPNDPPTLQT